MASADAKLVDMDVAAWDKALNQPTPEQNTAAYGEYCVSVHVGVGVECNYR